MQVVADTGPVLHLSEARALNLLQPMQPVAIPTTVAQELTRLLPGWKRPVWLHVEPLSTSATASAREWTQAGLLDDGEAEAIALTRQLHATWLLTDDTAARLFAQALGLEVHGSLGVVLWAVAHNHLDRTAGLATLQRLAASSLWISERVLAEAKTSMENMS